MAARAIWHLSGAGCEAYLTGPRRVGFGIDRWIRSGAPLDVDGELGLHTVSASRRTAFLAAADRPDAPTNEDGARLEKAVLPGDAEDLRPACSGDHGKQYQDLPQGFPVTPEEGLRAGRMWASGVPVAAPWDA